MAKEVQKLGEANLLYDGKVYENIPILEVKSESTWKGKTRRSLYYTTAPIEALKLSADRIRLYLMGGMDRDFEQVIKPFFEGEPLSFDNLKRKNGGTFSATYQFHPERVPDFLEKPVYQGTLEFYNESEDDDAFHGF